MDISYYKQYEPIFGSWYITGLIGAGSYGQVYTIEREELGIKYQAALKVITIPFNDAELRNIEAEGMTNAEVTSFYESMAHNIANEFILMSKLKGNSNIVSYEDHQVIEHSDGIGWDILIRMELLEPLVDKIKDNPLEQDEIVKLGIDLCKALELCNKYGIVHRDIKPDNIFIAPSGDYKIGDFGIAKIIDSSSVGLSRKGTFLYMAPEAYKGDRYGASADLYSVGLVLYKLFNNNRTPFLPDYPNPIQYNDREQSLFRRMKGEKIPAIKDVDDEINAILAKACEFDSHKRYRKAVEMRHALELYQREKENDRLGENRINAQNRKKRIIAAVVACILAVVLALPKHVTSVEGIDNISVLVGDEYQLEYEIHPFYFANSIPKYELNKPSVASIDGDTITAKKTGKTTVNMSFGDYSKKFMIKVEPKVTSFIGINSEYYITVGNEVQLNAVPMPEKYSKEKVSYISSNNCISVDSKGLVQAVAAGTATLVVSSGGYEQKMTFYVSNPTQVTIERPSSGKSTTHNNSKKSDYFDSSDDEYF